MVVGLRYAVQVDEAGGVTLRWDAAGLGHSWPGHIKDLGGVRTQFHHCIDIVPTILEATGIRAPEEVNGIKQKPIEGVSMVYTFDKANADAPSDPQDPILRDDRQPRDLPRWLGTPARPRPEWSARVKAIAAVNEYKWKKDTLSGLAVEQDAKHFLATR